ncbi:hypothetical protein ColTof4_00290 [Colletotrichum tofieldiae]|uniref:Uncharacterized protein n=1 Tax=Colletotrichum tofieldiae TaxID=708197 RepID=A0A166VM01_9PEZI|nr:hypothetical protein CT0861_07964 [Colletotrichum tofieldiae]GKT60158.1 hypothetical protein ColTof3_07497 [Colletotrichum tofieldiae]GKT67867.1 hypothetical protein ColTof4_00290 [Colletotrichum tofieldiae]GKT91165.1 hypothetical protein Ct61P_09015 [Colletotrichum tofieldiae]
MASLPSQHPSLALHLTDRALNPILTSAHSQPQLEALTSLTTTSLTAHAAANRFSLGPAQRIIVEHGPGSPVVLASFLNGADALPNGREGSTFAAANNHTSSASSRPVSSSVTAATAPIAESSTTAASSARTGAIPDTGKKGEDSENAAPMLIGVVVAATGEEAMEARRAAGRLERVGREFQREWAAEEGTGDVAGDGQ